MATLVFILYTSIIYVYSLLSGKISFFTYWVLYIPFIVIWGLLVWRIYKNHKDLGVLRQRVVELTTAAKEEIRTGDKNGNGNQ